MQKLFELFSAVIGVIGTVVFIIATVVVIGSLITWWAWNNFMPAVFHLPTITLWQAFAFNLLTNSLRGFNASFKSKS